MKVTTIYYNDAFPMPRERRELGIMVDPESDRGGDNYEFMVEEVPGHHREPIIGIRVKLFDDSWQAYEDLPAFFAGLVQLARADAKVTLEDVRTLCAGLGFEDTTASYAERCACGTHPPREVPE